MSISGVRRRRTTDDRADDALKSGEDEYIHKAKRHTDKGRQETGNAGPGAISGPSTPGASFLPISGKYGMLGSIAFNPVPVVIKDGRINIAPNPNEGNRDSSYLLVTGQGSPDELRFIDGATKNGQLLKMQGTETQIIIIKHALLNTISNISGLITVTVVTITDHGYATGEKINIIGTTNFNVSDVSITVTAPNTFTYLAIGNIIPETTGTTQNGNILTDNGQDLTLDASIFPNAIPMAEFQFDPSVEGFGAWREQSRSGSGGGSGDVTFPIDFPEEDLGILGDPGEPTLNFSWVDSNRHAKIIELDGDLTINIGTDLPTGTLGLTMFKLKQDGNGGHVVTFTGIVNASPSIDSTPNNTTYIGVQRMDEESLAFTVGDKIFIGSSGEEWSQFPATQPVNMANNQFFNYLGWTSPTVGQTFLVNLSGTTNTLPTGDTYKYQINGFDRFTISELGLDVHNLSMTRVAAIQIVDIGTGISRGSIVGDPVAEAIRLSLVTDGKFIISDNIIDIVQFDNTTGLKMIGTHVINMNNNVINTIRELQLSNANAHTPSNELSIAFDINDDALKYSVPLTTDTHRWYADTDLLATYSRIGTNEGQLSIQAVVASILQANDQVFLADAATNPTINGQFRRNGVDVKVFSGGIERNLSDVGGGFSGNLSDLAIDANKDWQIKSITNLAATSYVDIGGIARGSISGDATLGLALSTVAGGKFTIQDVITPIATFDDTVGLKIEGTHVINMNKNIINTIGSTQWDRTATFTPTAIDTIGFDTATMALKYNVALTTDIHSFQAAGELLASITRINPNVGALLMNGIGSVVQADILSATDKIITNNGFEIQNTDATNTTFAIPNNEFLKFTDGGVEVGQYDAQNNNWVFNPANDVQLSPDTDVDLTPGGDVIMNPTGDIRVFADLDMQTTNTIDMGTSASVPPGSATGAFQIKLNGVVKLVKFYDP